MARQGTHTLFSNMFSQRHSVEVCPKPCKPPKFIISSPHLLPDFSASRSDIPEKLVDKPVYFWFHEHQILSNLHRGTGGGMRL
jgi:hypothetical protein